MKQQTAVEWLLNAIETKNGEEFSSYYSEFIEQAKEMAKKRIAKAFTDGKGQNFSFYDKTGEEYYEQTYEGGEQ
jgi:hypothetical protein